MNLTVHRNNVILSLCQRRPSLEAFSGAQDVDVVIAARIIMPLAVAVDLRQLLNKAIVPTPPPGHA